MKEPEIKLFGRKILLPENAGAVAATDGNGDAGDLDRCLEELHDEKQLHAHEVIINDSQISHTHTN